MVIRTIQDDRIPLGKGSSNSKTANLSEDLKRGSSARIRGRLRRQHANLAGTDRQLGNGILRHGDSEPLTIGLATPSEGPSAGVSVPDRSDFHVELESNPNAPNVALRMHNSRARAQRRSHLAVKQS